MQRAISSACRAQQGGEPAQAPPAQDAQATADLPVARADVITAELLL